MGYPQSSPAAPTQRVSTGSQRQSQSFSTGNVVKNLPTERGEKASGAVGALTAEFIGGIALLFLTLFTDTTSSYSDKMLAIMKRGTLLAISFFLLALIGGQGPNAARVAKAFGLLIDAGLILSISSDEMLSEIDKFIQGSWKSGTSSSASAQAGSGSLGTSPSAAGGDVIQGVKSAAESNQSAVIKAAEAFANTGVGTAIGSGLNKAYDDASGAVKKFLSGLGL